MRRRRPDEPEPSIGDIERGACDPSSRYAIARLVMCRSTQRA
jgi:hypothetical protein